MYEIIELHVHVCVSWACPHSVEAIKKKFKDPCAISSFNVIVLMVDHSHTLKSMNKSDHTEYFF